MFEHSGEWAFDGKDMSHKDITWDRKQNPEDSFSVDFWVRSTGGGRGFQCPLSSREMPPPRGYCFFVGPQGNWMFWIGLPDSNEWLKLEGPAVKHSQWQRLMGTYCHATRFAKFHVDGLQVATKPVPASARSGFQANQRNPLRLGAGANESKPQHFFHGDVRGISVYNRVLSTHPTAPADNHQARAPQPTKKIRLRR